MSTDINLTLCSNLQDLILYYSDTEVHAGSYQVEEVIQRLERFKTKPNCTMIYLYTNIHNIQLCPVCNKILASTCKAVILEDSTSNILKLVDCKIGLHANLAFCEAGVTCL